MARMLARAIASPRRRRTAKHPSRFALESSQYESELTISPPFTGADALPGCQVDRVLDEVDAAVDEQDVDPAGMPAPGRPPTVHRSAKAIIGRAVRRQVMIVQRMAVVSIDPVRLAVPAKVPRREAIARRSAGMYVNVSANELMPEGSCTTISAGFGEEP